MSLKEIGSHAQNIINILKSTFNIISRRIYEHFNELKKVQFDNKQDIHTNSKFMRK